MIFGHFIKGRINHFALNRALHVSNFFRAFVNQQHDQLDFRIIFTDGTGDLF